MYGLIVSMMCNIVLLKAVQNAQNNKTINDAMKDPVTNNLAELVVTFPRLTTSKADPLPTTKFARMDDGIWKSIIKQIADYSTIRGKKPTDLNMINTFDPANICQLGITVHASRCRIHNLTLMHMNSTPKGRIEELKKTKANSYDLVKSKFSEIFGDMASIFRKTAVKIPSINKVDELADMRATISNLPSSELVENSFKPSVKNIQDGSFKTPVSGESRTFKSGNSVEGYRGFRYCLGHHSTHQLVHVW